MNTMTTTEPGTVDAELLKAIRKCDSLVFRRDNGTDTAWAVKRTRNPAPFEPYDRRYEFTPADSHVNNYTGKSGSFSTGPRIEPDIFTVIVEYGALEFLRTALRKGDTISASWIVGNNNNHLTAAGLRADECRIVIRRGAGVKRREIVIPAGYTVRPAGSRDCNV